MIITIIMIQQKKTARHWNKNRMHPLVPKKQKPKPKKWTVKGKCWKTPLKPHQTQLKKKTRNLKSEIRNQQKIIQFILNNKM